MSEDRSIREIRLEKLAQLRELGHDPYATEKFKIDHSAKHLITHFDELVNEETHPTISFAGRIVALREMGKAAFAHLSDGDDKIQIYVRKNDLDETDDTLWPAFKLLDIGDHLGITGYLFTTKTGEKSIHVQTLTPLSKALHTLPLGKEKDGEQWYGLTDVDQRYRHRHLDLITNREAREQLLNRSRIVSEVRRFFDARGYLEVETPLLQLEAGGAAARPFKTHYNAYDLEVKLRISLELYLKRIICGDVPKVYEIGRVFRNEGVSNRHNPEFTLLEWYEAYANLEDMMACVESLVSEVNQKVFRRRTLLAKFPTSIFSYVETQRLIYLSKFGTGKSRVSEKPISAIEIDLNFAPTSLPEGLIAEPHRSNVGSTDPLEEMFQQYPLSKTPAWDTQGVYKFYFDTKTWLLYVDCLVDSVDPGLSNAFQIFERGLYVVNISDLYDSQISTYFEIFREIEVDFSEKWRRFNLIEELALLADYDFRKACSKIAEIKNNMPDIGTPQYTEAVTVLAAIDRERVEALLRVFNRLDMKVNNDEFGRLAEKALEVFFEPQFMHPTFVIGYPIESSPLAKKDPASPGFTRRFEGYVLGREICNAFSEINDPIDQRERFEQQLGERDKGDDEAHPMDEQFIFALESGMPPTGGCGIGIDRLVMLLTGAEHLREILLFPMMRPEIHHDNPDVVED